MLEVVSKFPCTTITTIPTENSPQPQLLIGRITSLSKGLTSPYSCQKCAMYHIDCYYHNHKNSARRGWEKVYSEARSVTFSLQDPDDNASRVVNVPGKQLAVKYFNAEMYNAEMYDSFHEDSGVKLAELTPSVSALLSRSGLQDTDLSDIRLREWCVEENTQVGIFGILKSVMTAVDDDQIQMNPVCREGGGGAGGRTRC